jgi:hypothetical protein
MHRALRLKTALQWDKKPQNRAWSIAKWELAGVLYRKLTRRPLKKSLPKPGSGANSTEMAQFLRPFP